MLTTLKIQNAELVNLRGHHSFSIIGAFLQTPCKQLQDPSGSNRIIQSYTQVTTIQLFGTHIILVNLELLETSCVVARLN